MPDETFLNDHTIGLITAAVGAILALLAAYLRWGRKQRK